MLGKEYFNSEGKLKDTSYARLLKLVKIGYKNFTPEDHKFIEDLLDYRDLYRNPTAEEEEEKRCNFFDFLFIKLWSHEFAQHICNEILSILKILKHYPSKVSKALNYSEERPGCTDTESALGTLFTATLYSRDNEIIRCFHFIAYLVIELGASLRQKGEYGLFLSFNRAMRDNNQYDLLIILMLLTFTPNVISTGVAEAVRDVALKYDKERDPKIFESKGESYQFMIDFVKYFVDKNKMNELDDILYDAFVDNDVKIYRKRFDEAVQIVYHYKSSHISKTVRSTFNPFSFITSVDSRGAHSARASNILSRMCVKEEIFSLISPGQVTVRYIIEHLVNNGIALKPAHLDLAAKHNNMIVFDAILAVSEIRGIGDISAENFLESAIHRKANYNYDMIVKHIGDINMRDGLGKTFLIKAVQHGNLDAVKAILKHEDIDLTVKAQDDKDALEHSILSLNVDIAKTLIDAGALLEVNKIGILKKQIQSFFECEDKIKKMSDFLNAKIKELKPISVEKKVAKELRAVTDANTVPQYTIVGESNATDMRFQQTEEIESKETQKVVVIKPAQKNNLPVSETEDIESNMLQQIRQNKGIYANNFAKFALMTACATAAVVALFVLAPLSIAITATAVATVSLVAITATTLAKSTDI